MYAEFRDWGFRVKGLKHLEIVGLGFQDLGFRFTVQRLKPLEIIGTRRAKAASLILLPF